MEILKIENLHKKYGNKIGAKDVSFELKPGEVFGFIGPNGAGKSTTLRCVMGLIEITSGKVTLFGQDLSDVNREEINKRIGYVPAEASFYDYMTAGDMLRYSADLKGVDHSKIYEISEILELDLKTQITKLSFGNRKKVSIINAMLGDPDLIILDEPTSGLDPLIQQRFFELLRKVSNNGGTVLFSSHNLSEVQKHCDRVAIIKDGEIIKLEDIKELRKKNLRIVEIIKRNNKKISLRNSNLVEEKDGVSTYEHFGSVKELAEDLAKIDPINVFIEQADLDKVFMHYYEREGN